MRAPDPSSYVIEPDALRAFMGRDAELSAIVQAAVERRTAVVEGIAGIGKTRLLQEAADRLRTDGVEVIALSGSEATAVIPLSPLLRLCPPGAQDAGPAIISELYRRSRAGPVAVVVDDAQLLDDATAAIVRQLAAVELIGLVVALRTGEQAPRSIRSISDDGIGELVPIGALDRTSTARLVHRLLGPSLESVTESIWVQSGGHPLFIRELIVAGVETGALRPTAAGWEAESSPIWSARLRALMANRLLTLDPSERTAMELLAVAGQVEFPVVAELVDPDILLALERRALLRIDNGFVEIDHPIFQTAVLETTQPSHSAALRRELADALEAASEDPDLVRVTDLRLAAGERLDAQTLQRAIDEALRLRLPKEAEVFARAASDAGLEQANGLLALALAMQWRWEDADEAFGRYHEPDDDLAVRWMEVNFEYRADPAAVETLLSSMLADPDHPLHVDALALRARMFVDDLDVVLADHERFGDSAHLPPDLEDLVAVDIATCASHSLQIDRLDRVLAGHRDRLDGMDPLERIRLTSSAIMCRLVRDGPDATRSLIEEETARARELADPDVEVLAISIPAFGMNIVGRHADAIEGIRVAAEISAFARHRRHESYLFTALASSLAMVDGGDDEAEELLRSEASWPDGARFMTRPIADFGRAVLADRRGDDPHALVDTGIDHARRRHSRVHEAGLLWLRAQFGRPDGAIEGLEAIHSFSGAQLVALMAADAAALLSGNVRRLERVSAQAASFGTVAIAAEAADRAAATHHRLGDLAAACAWQRQVDRLLATQPGQRLLGPVRRSTNVLSTSEVPVVDAVLDGASNRDIAASLFISHRTVESHLRRVYRRLGVSGRAELTAALQAPFAIEPPSASPASTPITP